jgi:hypothetical protein
MIWQSLSTPDGNSGASLSLAAASKDWEILREFEGEDTEAFARTLYGLLHGEKNFGQRFLLFSALVGDGSWIISTLFFGLMNPAEHVIVRP